MIHALTNRKQLNYRDRWVMAPSLRRVCGSILFLRENYMNINKYALLFCLFFLAILIGPNVMLGAATAQPATQATSGQPKVQEIGRITVEELKAKMAKNEPMM